MYEGRREGNITAPINHNKERLDEIAKTKKRIEEYGNIITTCQKTIEHLKSPDLRDDVFKVHLEFIQGKVLDYIKNGDLEKNKSYFAGLIAVDDYKEYNWDAEAETNGSWSNKREKYDYLIGYISELKKRIESKKKGLEDTMKKPKKENTYKAQDIIKDLSDLNNRFGDGKKLLNKFEVAEYKSGSEEQQFLQGIKRRHGSFSDFYTKNQIYERRFLIENFNEILKKGELQKKFGNNYAIVEAFLSSVSSHLTDFSVVQNYDGCSDRRFVYKIKNPKFKDLHKSLSTEGAFLSIKHYAFEPTYSTQGFEKLNTIFYDRNSDHVSLDKRYQIISFFNNPTNKPTFQEKKEEFKSFLSLAIDAYKTLPFRLYDNQILPLQNSTELVIFDQEKELKEHLAKCIPEIIDFMNSEEIDIKHQEYLKKPCFQIKDQPLVQGKNKIIPFDYNERKIVAPTLMIQKLEMNLSDDNNIHWDSYNDNDVRFPTCFDKDFKKLLIDNKIHKILIPNIQMNEDEWQGCYESFKKLVEDNLGNFKNNPNGAMRSIFDKIKDSEDSEGFPKFTILNSAGCQWEKQRALSDFFENLEIDSDLGQDKDFFQHLFGEMNIPKNGYSPIFSVNFLKYICDKNGYKLDVDTTTNIYIPIDILIKKMESFVDSFKNKDLGKYNKYSEQLSLLKKSIKIKEITAKLQTLEFKDRLTIAEPTKKTASDGVFVKKVIQACENFTSVRNFATIRGEVEDLKDEEYYNKMFDIKTAIDENTIEISKKYTININIINQFYKVLNNWSSKEEYKDKNGSETGHKAFAKKPEYQQELLKLIDDYNNETKDSSEKIKIEGNLGKNEKGESVLLTSQQYVMSLFDKISALTQISMTEFAKKNKDFYLSTVENMSYYEKDKNGQKKLDTNGKGIQKKGAIRSFRVAQFLNSFEKILAQEIAT